MKKLIILLAIWLFISNSQAEETLLSPAASPSPSAPASQSSLNLSASEKTGDTLSTNFLDPDAAFILSTRLENLTTVIVHWQIAAGYYLYRDKFKFLVLQGGTLENIELPPTESKSDKYYGKIQVYYREVTVKLPITVVQQATTLNLEIHYQGCAEAGLCYPPLVKTVDLSLTPPELAKNNSTVKEISLSEQDRIADELAKNSFFYTILAFFGFGLLLSLTPCVFPMIPILSGIIVGQGKNVTTYRAFIMSLTYVLAMAVTYTIVGVMTGLLGANLQALFQNTWILIIFSSIFVILACSMFGFYELQLPNTFHTKLTQLSNRQTSGQIIGVAIMGFLSALIVSPCVAAPLAGALLYIGKSGSAVLGGCALFSLSIGMGIPLILVGTSAGHFLPKSGSWMESVKAIFGVMLLGMAIWLLARLLPGQVVLLLWAILCITSSIYMGALETRNPGMSGWYKLWKGLGIVLLIYGILLMIGVASGGTQLFKPLHNLLVSDTFRQGSEYATSRTSESKQIQAFKAIKGVNGLAQELAIAKTQGKLVMLDFYADWCVACQEMDNLTFNDANVQKLLSKIMVLRTDVTANDEQDKALYKQFTIFGPPAVLFFTADGQEQPAYRVVGFMSAEEFRQHLTKLHAMNPLKETL